MSEVTEEYGQKYAAVITPAGLAAMASAMAAERMLAVTHVAFGDGGGEEYLPDKTQSDIKNEVYVTESADIYVEPTNPNCVIIATTIPADQGGWNIREAAMRLANGDTVAVASMSTVYKPVTATGAGMGIRYEFALLVSNAEVFELKISPESEAIRNAIDAHNSNADAHGGLVQQAVDKAQEVIDEAVKEAQDAAQSAQDAASDLESSVNEKLILLEKTVTEKVEADKTARLICNMAIRNGMRVCRNRQTPKINPYFYWLGKVFFEWKRSNMEW